MFANTQSNGIDVAIVDACTRRTDPAAPIVASRDMAFGCMGVGVAHAVFVDGMPAHTLATVVPCSVGDHSSVQGAVSGGSRGSSRHLTGASSVLVGGVSATRVTSITLHNGHHSQGARVMPSQLKVLILAR